MGLTTGFLELDRATGGLQSGELIVVGARRSMGKTALALHVAEHLASNEKRPVGIFSLDHRADDVAHYFLSLLSQIKPKHIRSGRLRGEEWKRFTHAAASLQALPIRIDDTAALSIEEMAIRAKEMHAEHGVQLLIVDFIQLIQGRTPAKESNERMEEIYNGLKKIAQDLSIPIFAITQLKEDVEGRGHGYRPCISDIPGNDGIDRYADLVIFICHDEYYYSDSHGVGAIEASVDRQNEGLPGTIRTVYLQNLRGFEPLSRS